MWQQFLDFREAGFLGFRGTFMLDLVVVAMVLVLPVLGASIWAVKFRKAYRLHKTLQIILGIVLLATVLIFEVDVRVFGWKHKAEPSPYYNTWLFPVFYVHLVIAVSTTLLWIWVTGKALRHFPSPPAPCEYSRHHLPQAKVAGVGMFLTAVTGWIFYYMAFVA
jgi:putative membrane protein